MVGTGKGSLGKGRKASTMHKQEGQVLRPSFKILVMVAQMSGTKELGKGSDHFDVGGKLQVKLGVCKFEEGRGST